MVPSGSCLFRFFGTIVFMPRTLQTLREDAIAIWKAGVEAVRSDRLVRENVQIADGMIVIGELELPLNQIDRIAVVGAGKAGAGMALGLEQALGAPLSRDKKLAGVMNVPADCATRKGMIELVAARPAAINEPTAEGVRSSRRMVELVRSLGPRDLCICLISGGGSALLPLPREGVSLADKLAVTRLLAARGANIEELNTVRKHLSAIKGGRLGAECRAGTLVTLVISDVMGDPLDVIASGPTYLDSTTAMDAIAVLERFQATREPWFGNVKERLLTAQKPASPTASIYHLVIGNNPVAVDAAGVEAEKRGYSHAMTSSRTLEGDAEPLGRSLARIAKRMRDERGPDCLISGGEPIVAWSKPVKRGLGGRNQQLALAAYDELAGEAQGITFLSGGTDGEDGPTDAAGAIFDATTHAIAAEKGLDPAAFLARQDAYPFFEQVSGLLKTGPTHTNVGDLRVIVVDRVEDQRSSHPTRQ